MLKDPWETTVYGEDTFRLFLLWQVDLTQKQTFLIDKVGERQHLMTPHRDELALSLHIHT